MPTAVRFLRWCDVDPATRAFDAGPARRIAEERIVGALAGQPTVHVPRLDREALEASIDRDLIAEYGAWAAGWRWAASEPGGGGPVRGWCCARDSLLRRDDRDADASIERVVAALVEWRAFLEELAALFASLHRETGDCGLDEGAERAAARLLPLVVERTSAEDAWYATFESVLAWYLESAAHDPEVSRKAIGEVISGRFSSWIEPPAETVREACGELGRAVAKAAIDPPLRPDALAAWWTARARAFPGAPMAHAREPVRSDAHRRYIDGVDRARAPERAARMSTALDACRASALRGEPLTFERLLAWQELVLGRPVELRSHDAYAKGGRERYGFDDKTHRRFVAALDEAGDDATAVSVRAARVYLDVCFVHPFDDGNARAARLALDHVVTRAGLALHAVEPLFVVARSAADQQGAWSLAWVIEYLLGEAISR